MLIRIGVVLAALTMTTAYVMAPDLQGVYCGKTTNRIKCCRGRIDDCSHFIKGTKCYCDEFCSRNSSKHDDCCPDYLPVCRPDAPQPIIKLDLICTEGHTRRDNCNVCTCTPESEYQTNWVCTSDPCIISEDVINSVNRHRGGWTASNYTQFWGRKLIDGFKYKLGTYPINELALRMIPDPSYASDALPHQFDARQQWPGYISPVYDQGWCGSDWAVSAAAVASDRFAIQSLGAEKVVLSAQHLICQPGGCRGGHIDYAWLFVRREGLVDESCLPYTGENRSSQCPPRGATLASAGCSGRGRDRPRYKTTPVKRLGSVEDIKYEIYNSGPVQAVMKVRQDFFLYRGGIYRHVKSSQTNEKSALHAVRIVGWGEEREQKYWIVANSWGEGWGEGGYFRIARGENESDIESFVLTTLAVVNQANRA